MTQNSCTTFSKAGVAARRMLLVIITGLLTMTTLATPGWAQEHSEGLRARLWVGSAGRYILKDNETFQSGQLGTVSLKVNGSAPVVGADAEYRFNRWLGVDGALAYTRFKVDFAAPGTASTQSLDVVPLLVALNVHVIDTARVDIWVGPQIGYVMFPNSLSYSIPAGNGSFQYQTKGTFSKEGFVVGSDIKVTRGLAINAAFRWQNADSDGDSHLTVDPAFLTVGLTKRF